MSEGAVPASRQTMRRCIRSVKDLLTSEVRWRALTLATLLVGFLFAINGLNVVNSYVARDFMTAIAGRDMPGFTRQALLYLAVFAVSTAVAVCILLIVAHDRPFTGQLSVRPTVLLQVQPESPVAETGP